MHDKPKYNPIIHHRRSIRLKGYDYSQAGLYFITICCQDRINRFGQVENGEMILNEYGTIAYNEWAKLPERFQNFELDVFQIMPNHMHGIIALVGAGFTPAQNNQQPNLNNEHLNLNNEHLNLNNEHLNLNNEHLNLNNQQPNNDIGSTERGAPTVSDIVGAYKSLVANGCLDIYKSKNETMGKFWQRNYYENIIRNEQSYQRISKYIVNNPSKWVNDKFYKK